MTSRYYTDDRRYFTLASFYGEFARPWGERSLPMSYAPHPDGLKVYERWKELNG